jgi:hypothetical protein
MVALALLVGGTTFTIIGVVQMRSPASSAPPVDWLVIAVGVAGLLASVRFWVRPVSTTIEPSRRVIALRGPFGTRRFSFIDVLGIDTITSQSDLAVMGLAGMGLPILTDQLFDVVLRLRSCADLTVYSCLNLQAARLEAARLSRSTGIQVIASPATAIDAAFGRSQWLNPPRKGPPSARNQSKLSRVISVDETS